MTGTDTLIAWLNDAYGMENSLMQILEHQIKDAESYPQVQTMLQQHLEETRQHADTVKGCIQQLGGDTSALKTGMATIFGKIQALSTGAASDEMVKNALADYAAECFEVASYRALIAGASEAGEAQVATACRQILEQDQAMADWIIQNLPTLVKQEMASLAGSRAG